VSAEADLGSRNEVVGCAFRSHKEDSVTPSVSRRSNRPMKIEFRVGSLSPFNLDYRSRCLPVFPFTCSAGGAHNDPGTHDYGIQAGVHSTGLGSSVLRLRGWAATPAVSTARLRISSSDAPSSSVVSLDLVVGVFFVELSVPSRFAFEPCCAAR
jgi:hypothetical protein